MVQVRCERRGGSGREVTLVSGLSLPGRGLRELAAELKRLCSSGGSVRQDAIEIQGDHRDTVVAALKIRGYSVELNPGSRAP